MKYVAFILLLPVLAPGADLSSLCSDRATIERIYYQHRLGEKPPFAQVLPPTTVEKLVRQDLNKEVALKKNYHVEITPAMLDTEVQRINATTRAPDVLAEIKSALGNDPGRLAESFVKPIVVERLLREKFANDDSLHAAQRHEVEQTRNSLLAAKTNSASFEQMLVLLQRAHSNAVTQTTWQLASRPAETNSPTTDELEIKKRFGSNAQILSSPHSVAEKGTENYFEDLPGELQNVLRVQLRQSGDVSAVIETPGGFLLYLTKEKTAEKLSVATLSIAKRSYEQWLEEQAIAKP